MMSGDIKQLGQVMQKRVMPYANKKGADQPAIDLAQNEWNNLDRPQKCK